MHIFIVQRIDPDFRRMGYIKIDIIIIIVYMCICFPVSYFYIDFCSQFIIMIILNYKIGTHYTELYL